MQISDEVEGVAPARQRKMAVQRLSNDASVIYSTVQLMYLGIAGMAQISDNRGASKAIKTPSYVYM